MTNAIISANKLFNALMDKGVGNPAIMLGDSVFSLPARKWLRGEFSEWLTRRLVGRPYIQQAYDCENYALEATACACEAHRLSVLGGKAENTGIAFGELWIQARAHAICFAAHNKKGGGIDIVAYEPQVAIYKARVQTASLAIVKLTPADWQSVILAKAQ